MPDTISGASDSELLTIATQMLAAINAAPANFGLTVAQAGELDFQKDAFNTALNDHTAAQANAQSKTAAKNTERTTLIDLIRTLRNIAKAAGTSEANMESLGIPEGSQAAPANATIPVGSVDTSVRLRHTIGFVDADADGNKRKPRGVVGCEIWVKFDGPPPTDEKECTFLTLDTQTPYVAEFEGSSGGKMAHYMLRWAMRDGSKGGWGETVSATITA